jgi:hypothetical protein
MSRDHKGIIAESLRVWAVRMADVYIDICKNIIAILPYMHTPILYTMHYNIHVQTAQRSYTSPGIGLHKAPYPCERGRAVNCSEHRAREYDRVQDVDQPSHMSFIMKS